MENQTFAASRVRRSYNRQSSRDLGRKRKAEGKIDDNDDKVHFGKPVRRVSSNTIGATPPRDDRDRGKKRSRRILKSASQSRSRRVDAACSIDGGRCDTAESIFRFSALSALPTLAIILLSAHVTLKLPIITWVCGAERGNEQATIIENGEWRMDSAGTETLFSFGYRLFGSTPNRFDDGNRSPLTFHSGNRKASRRFAIALPETRNTRFDAHFYRACRAEYNYFETDHGQRNRA